MNAYRLLGVAAGATLVAGAFAGAKEEPREGSAVSTTEAPGRKAAAEPIELSGRLRGPPKWSPQLEVVPAGQIQRFDLRGDLLEGLKDGTPIRVKGAVRSFLHRGGTVENPSPFPSQWTVWLEVTEVKVMEDPLDVLK